MAKRNGKGRGKRHQRGGAATAEAPEPVVERDLEKVLDAEAEADAKANGMQATAVLAPVGGDGAQEAPKKDDPAELERQRKAVAFDLIAGLNKGAFDAFRQWHSVNEHAKRLKKQWEGKVAELQAEIAKAETPPPMPLFDKKPGANGDHKPAEHTPADESWKAVKLEEAMPDVSEAVLAKLHAANLHTVGELAAWTAADGGRHRITDVPGVGAATAEKIEEALTAFWARQKEAAEQKPEQVPDPQENGGQGDDAAGTEKEDEEAADDDQDEGDDDE